MPSRQFQELYAGLKAQPSREQLSIEELREAGLRKAAQFPLPDDVSHEAVDAGGVPAEWVHVSGAAEETLLYFHGGGYYRGSVETVRELCGRLSRAAGLRVLSVDYRLAPEHTFPAPVEDAQRAYRWLRGQGVAPRRIAVAGDSAGGGITVALLLALRDAGAPLPAAAVCIAPWVDLTQSGASMEALAERDLTVSRAYLTRFAELYLGGADAREPLASPLFAELTGLPPLLIQASAAEVLRDDAVRLAERLRAAGCVAELDLWEDMTHVWHNNGPELPEAQEAVARIGAFLKARLGV